MSDDVDREIDLLECAIYITQECEKKRHFTGITGNVDRDYIFCCAYTAPVLAIAIMWLEQHNIRNIDEFNAMLSKNEILSPRGNNPLTGQTMCQGINESIAPIWSHHYHKKTGIDIWLSKDQDYFNYFDVQFAQGDKVILDPGINLISFTNEQIYSIHHSLIYVSKVVGDYCYIIDSWSSCGFCRKLTRRIHNTQDVVDTLSAINANGKQNGFTYDQKRIANNITGDLMIKYFQDPVDGGSCRKPLQVFKLNNTAIKIFMEVNYPHGVHGEFKYGGKKIKRTNKSKKSKTKKSKKSNKSKTKKSQL
jgi:hypothetical protein